MKKLNREFESSVNTRHLIPDTISIDTVPDRIFSLGNPEILERLKLAFFCSIRCPGDSIIQGYDFSQELRDTGIAVIGGFQSPIEKDCLDILLRGTQPVIICPARSLYGMRIPSSWKTAINENRLLLLSPFEENIRRPTAELSEKRNEFVTKLADQILFAYAEPGGKTEALARKAICWGKPVFTFDTRDNSNLLELGVKVIEIDKLVSELKPKQNGTER